MHCRAQIQTVLMACETVGRPAVVGPVSIKPQRANMPTNMKRASLVSRQAAPGSTGCLCSGLTRSPSHCVRKVTQPPDIQASSSLVASSIGPEGYLIVGSPASPTSWWLGLFQQGLLRKAARCTGSRAAPSVLKRPGIRLVGRWNDLRA